MAKRQGFLGGRVQLVQPEKGYRAGLDAALLAQSLRAKHGEVLLELGCGAGACLLSAAARLENCRFEGVEKDPEMAALAQGNSARNKLESRVNIICVDITALDGKEPVDQVFFNPPFYEDAAAMRAPADAKRTAFMEGDAPLSLWIEVALKRLKPKGGLTLIHRAERLPKILALAPKAAAVRALMVHPREAEAAKRVLVGMRLGSRASFETRPPLFLHNNGPEKFIPEAEAILRGEQETALWA